MNYLYGIKKKEEEYMMKILLIPPEEEKMLLKLAIFSKALQIHKVDKAYYRQNMNTIVLLMTLMINHKCSMNTLNKTKREND